MDIKNLKENINKNAIPPFMIFNVKNGLLCKQYINVISKKINRFYKVYGSADEILYEIDNNIQKEEKLYIVLNDDKIIKNENYIQELINTNRPIILYFTELNKKDKFYKNNKQYIYDFEELDKDTLTRYVQKYLNIETYDIEEFIKRCDNNYGCCVNELDKMRYLDDGTLRKYIKNKEYSNYKTVNTFEFVNKIIYKNKSAYEDIYCLNDNAMNIIITLYRIAKLKYKGNKDTRLIHIMQVCVDIENKIKRGDIGSEYVLDYLLLKTI